MINIPSNTTKDGKKDGGLHVDRVDEVKTRINVGRRRVSRTVEGTLPLVEGHQCAYIPT